MIDTPQIRRPLAALAATLVVQTLAALAQSIPSVLAPVIASELAVGSHHIGTFTGVLYVCAMLSGLLLSGAIASHGAIRLSQWAMLACAAGLLAAATGSVATVILAAALIGVGYGLANPTAAVILGRHAPARHRGLLFSIKQTGVPLGIAVSGLLAPVLLLQFSWQSALIAGALSCGLCALVLQAGVGLFDTRSANGSASFSFAPLFQVLADPVYRMLALVSTAYAMTQVCFLVFLVTFLSVEKHLSLPAAASLLAVAQLTSIAGRPFWGWLGDRWGRPATLLGLLGVAAGVSCLLLAALPHDSIWATGIVMFCGATAVGWNGVFFAELARCANNADMGTVTGGVQFMTFAGAMGGPLLFAACIALGASYQATFAMLAVFPLMAGLVLLYREGRKRRR